MRQISGGCGSWLAAPLVCEFARAAGLLEELAGVRLIAKRAEGAAEASGALVAAAGRDRARLIAARKLIPLPPSPPPGKLYAAIDGTGVPMTSKETAGRHGTEHVLVYAGVIGVQPRRVAGRSAQDVTVNAIITPSTATSGRS